MRILYLADIRFPLERANGIQTMETCHALARRGHEVALVVREDLETPPRDPFAFYDLEPLNRLTIARVPGPRHPASAARLAYLGHAVWRAAGPRRSDAILTRDLGVASLLLRIPRVLRPPVVYESHGYAPAVAAALPELISTASRPSARKLERLGRREAHVWHGADGYVTITYGLAADLRERFGDRDRIAVIADATRVPPQGVGPDNRPEPIESEASTLTVGYAGHVYAWKGVSILLDALARVPAARGLIVGGHEGEADLGRLRQQARALGIAERVTFTGLVPPGRVAGMLASADVLALPNPASAISTHFTSPLKLFEYLAAGKAIVASDLPAIREVLQHDVNAVLVAPGDPDALAAAIVRLMADAGLRRRLARTARESVAEYTWDRRAERLEAVLLQACGAAR